MDKNSLVKKISIAVGILIILAAILTNFMPILNIKLSDVISDYQFTTAAGHDFIGWQCIFFWWGPSIFIGGV